MDDHTATGVIRGRPEHADPDMADAYRWMHQHLIARGLMNGGDWPLWGGPDRLLAQLEHPPDLGLGVVELEPTALA